MATEDTGKSLRRAEGWIWGAINPLIDALQRERSLLDGGNLTWRAYSGRPEWIHPPMDYLDANGQILLEDLLEHEGLNDDIRRHEQLITHTVSAAAQYAQELLSSQDFRTEVHQAIAEYAAATENKRSERDAFPHGRPESVIGERLVNNTSTLSQAFTDAEFWDMLQGRFVRFRHTKESADLKRAIDGLRNDTTALIDTLRRKRRELSDRYDVAPAPVSRS